MAPVESEPAGGLLLHLHLALLTPRAPAAGLHSPRRQDHHQRPPHQAHHPPTEPFCPCRPWLTPARKLPVTVAVDGSLSSGQ